MSQKQNGERPSTYSCISTIITAATPLSGGSPPSVESTTWLGITASRLVEGASAARVTEGHEELVALGRPHRIDHETALFQLRLEGVGGELGADLGQHLLARGKRDVEVEIDHADGLVAHGP